MKKPGKKTFQLQGPSGTLSIDANDKIARKLAMLYLGECTDIGPTKAAEQLGYTKQTYFTTRKKFFEHGSKALYPERTGPKTNYVRTENVTTQVIRYKFLDPDSSSAVIAQKMRQTGLRVSQRSVERVIAEHGLQKKTLQVPSQRKRRNN